MMHNQFDRLQRSNLALADERDELKRVVDLHEQTIREMIDRSSEFMRETGDMIATIEQEARQMRARNERLESEIAQQTEMMLNQAMTIKRQQREVAECLDVIRDLINPNLGGIGHIAPWAITKAREIVGRLGVEK